jgi:hypothetical protein
MWEDPFGDGLLVLGLCLFIFSVGVFVGAWIW